MPQIAMSRIAVPSNTPEGKGKAIVLAQFNNSAGVIDGSIWNDLMDAIKEAFAEAIKASKGTENTPVVHLEYSVMDGKDPVQLVDLPPDFEDRLAAQRRVKGTKPDLSQLLMAALSGRPLADSAEQIYGPVMRALQAMEADKPGTLPDHAKALIDRMVAGDYGPETVKMLGESVDKLKAAKAERGETVKADHNNPASHI